MSTYTTDDLHTSADKVLEIIRTIPKVLKMSENAGNWIGLEDLRKHIRKTEKLYIDDQTLDILIGLLIGRNEIECHKAHGRGVGYFFIVRPTQEHQPL